MGLCSLVLLAAIAAPGDDAAALRAQSARLEATFIRLTESEVVKLTADLETAKRATINARGPGDKQVVGKKFVYRSREAKKADIEKLTSELDSAQKRLELLRRGGELALPSVGDEQHKVGSFYFLDDGSAFEVINSGSCYWEISFVIENGGVATNNSSLYLLKNLEALDRDKPETLKLQGKIFKFTGIVPRFGESIGVFELVEHATVEAARKR